MEKATPTAKGKKARIGEMLIQDGLITVKELEEALQLMKDKGGKTVENLIVLGHLKPKDFLAFLAKQPGVASVDLLNYTIPEEMVDLIPAEFAFKHELVPMDQMGGDLTVGMACPLDSKTVQELEVMTGLRVRTLLVSFNDIRAALNRYYGSNEPQQSADDSLYSSVMGNVKPQAKADATIPELLPQVESALAIESIVRMVNEVNWLPALPETVSRVRQAMDDPDSTAMDVSEILALDPALTAKLLSLANSSAFSFSHHIDSVERAVALLGLREVYSVVMTAVVVDYFDRSKFFDYRDFWRHSMLCASLCAVIAKACGEKNTRHASVGGLLHDLGKLVFAEVAPEQYAEVEKKAEKGRTVDLENDRFGISHAEIGYVLAQDWGIPPEISMCIRFHHDLSRASDHQNCVATVSLASHITDEIFFEQKACRNVLSDSYREAMDVLGLSEQQVLGFVDDAFGLLEGLGAE